MMKNNFGVPDKKGSVRTMQKKIFSWAMCMATAAMLACTGCAQNDTETAESIVTQSAAEENAENTTEESADVISGEPLSAVQSGSMGVTADEDDLCGTYDSFDGEITLKDGATAVSGSNADAVTVDGDQISITAGGTYRLTGMLTNGQVLVTGAEKVKLYLDGVKITNAAGPALVCINEKRTIVSLAADTENILADSAANAAYLIGSQEIDPCALYAQDKLTINGAGSLTVSGNSADGLICKDDLKLVSGKISVDAVENGVKGKDCVAMFGAELDITAGNDGIKSTETADTTKGFLQLEQGNVSVQAGGDCLQAETLVWIQDGTYVLTSSGTAVNGETGEANSAKGVHCSGDVEITGGTVSIDAPEDGVHCAGVFDMQDGTVDVTSSQDGIQADSDLLLSGGTVSVVTTGEVAASAQDDFGGGMHGGFGGQMPDGEMPQMPGGQRPDGAAPEMPGGQVPAGENGDAAQTVYGLVQAVNWNADTLTDTADIADTTATENATSKGIKCGGNLTLSGGSCTIVSTDHAIHATGTALFDGADLDITSDNKGISVHGDLTISDGNITIQQCTEGIESKANMTISGGNVRILNASDDGLNTGGTGESHAMTISGGYLYVCADGDGLDSNGTWDMTGGTVIVCGPISGGDGSMDANGTATYSGGTLLALSSRGMMEYPESGCLVATNCSASAGDSICIVGEDGTVLAAVTTPKEVSDVIFGIGDASAEAFTIVVGGTYNGTYNEDGFGQGGTVTGGTEVTANGGSGSMQGGMQPGGGMRGGGRQGDFGGKMQPDNGTLQ
ncbi:carbohydrate-binding domain-containing protein [uncultured Ruminococcus sp.]|uniref:carbohydrate-binding domain-containing protein n=2 Tax=uncultured Ruminococcus sp. TaxID=165186 RepID=UPI002610894F|nr:carbohydrate-binding domain-containing protein [uncultured Ruminococcus sp.]